jgi:N-acetylneuraminate synthase
MDATPADGHAPVVIGGRPVGPGHPVYVIAEISANHNGSLERALELVAVAAGAGADAVKLQTFTPDTMTLDEARPPFVVEGGTPWDGRTLYDLYAEAQTPWEWHEAIFAAASAAGIAAFSTPFDRSAVDFLDALDVPAFKIASFEIVDLALITYAASKGRPLVISTGMATEAEVDDAVRVARDAGASGVVLLRCNSAYPASAGEMDLATIPDMARRWSAPVGLSDHTLGTTAAVAAVALGACALEKHVTLSRDEPGPDASFSLEPDELRATVAAVREASAALGSVRYGPSPAEARSAAFRRSLFVVRDVAAGAVVTADDVRALRPADGLAPRHLDDVVGRRAAVAIPRGTPLAWALLSDD